AMNKNKMARYLWIGIYAILLTGCAVGPDFRRPAPPNATNYTSMPLTTESDSSASTLGNPQKIIKGEQLTKYWWRAMNADKLDILISEALEHNPTLLAAKATLRQAQELYTARAGSTLYPQLEGNL